MTNGDAKNKHIALAYSIAYNSCVFNRPKGAEIVLLNAPGRGGKFLRFSYGSTARFNLDSFGRERNWCLNGFTELTVGNYVPQPCLFENMLIDLTQQYDKLVFVEPPL